MIRRFLALFRPKGVLVPDISKLAEGEARSVDVGDILAGGRRVILCRVDGEVHALDSRCPHEGGQISIGPLHQGKFAVCPLHQYHFNPKNGKEERNLCGAARRYKVVPHGDGIEVFVPGVG